MTRVITTREKKSKLAFARAIQSGKTVVYPARFNALFQDRQS